MVLIAAIAVVAYFIAVWMLRDSGYGSGVNLFVALVLAACVTAAVLLV